MPHTPAVLQSLSVQIAAHLQHSGSADEALAALLADTATADWQAALCEALLTDDVFAAQVAARSYRHGNGFLKVVLLDRGFKLRLHLWLPGASCEENIHDHRWSIASTILAGSLHSEIWADAANDEQFDLQAGEYRYQAAVDGQPARAIPLHSAPLRLVERNSRSAGSHYALPPATLHRICSHGRQLVATLMCSGPAVAGHTRLIAGREGLLPEVAARRLSVAELRAGIGHFTALAGLFPALAA
ncbi:hypothetical protein [Pseudomonas sp. AN-1]|uniref:hypothetical protein n=1 Tax=Pseudomonas sp. AN-1 TaxID=3096605 RepID=UPI002A6A9786|nr:hypothetical protein [Pseudomonas sp. AN-1]WPP46943.1 hypothetical protein SK095_05975 [Pseudomonas sp. AN-1]